MAKPEKIVLCERFLTDVRFTQSRVTILEDLVRIEVSPQVIQRFFEASMRENVVQRYKKLEFSFVGLDLEGFSIRKSQECKSSSAEEKSI